MASGRRNIVIGVIVVLVLVVSIAGVYMFLPAPAPVTESCSPCPASAENAPEGNSIVVPTQPCDCPSCPSNPKTPVTPATNDVAFAEKLRSYWDETSSCSAPTCMTRLKCEPCLQGAYSLMSDYRSSGGVMTGPVRAAYAHIQAQYQVQGLIRERGRCSSHPRDDTSAILGDDFFHVFTPTADCEDRFRAGPGADGGKILCNPSKLATLPHRCVSYSFGTHTEKEYDRTVEKLFGCDVYTFDPTVSTSGSTNPHNRWGLGPCVDTHKMHHFDSIPSETWDKTTHPESWELGKAKHPCYDLRTISEKLKHSNVDILKMDVEGAEIAWLAYVSQSDPSILNDLGVKMVLLEYHGFNGSPYWFKDSMTCLRRNNEVGRMVRVMAEMGFYMYAFEYNILWAETQSGKGGGAEYAFVHKDWM